MVLQVIKSNVCHNRVAVIKMKLMKIYKVIQIRLNQINQFLKRTQI